MQGSQRGGRRPNRRRGNGNRRGPNSIDHEGGRSSQQASQETSASQQPFATIAQPSLTIDLPDDTPKFASLADERLVHPILLQTINEDMKFDHMTPVQAATIHQLLKERKDMLAQAKTGTGKTMAFLLPAVQTLINRNRKPGSRISALVISPTRELAMQIANEATILLQRLPQYKVCTAIGGTNKDAEERRILRGCDILIGTPGRLLDHFKTDEGDYSAVHEMLQNLDTLVLDEADRMLDIGFLPALKQIINCLPDKKATERQGMLFSATIADHVQKVAHLALSQGYSFVSTIPQGELGTHERVPQHLVIVPTFSDMAAGLVGALRQELKHVGEDKFKTIIFAPTAALVDFYAEVLQRLQGLPSIVTLHARMTQSKRTRTTDEFRNAQNGILLATDVIARGMDFPSVTNVFQVGIPADKESYIHRLGRTARAGAEGRGTFIVTQHEKYFPVYQLKDVAFEQLPPDLSARGDVTYVAERLDPAVQKKAYQSWLGFYKTSVKPLGWTVEQLVREANALALDGLGAPEVPSLQKSTVGKMGLKGVKGLVIGPDEPRAPRGQGQSRAGAAANGEDSQSKRRRR